MSCLLTAMALYQCLLQLQHAYDVISEINPEDDLVNTEK